MRAEVSKTSFTGAYRRGSVDTEESAWLAGRAINEAGLAFRQSQAEVLSQVSKPKEPTRLGYRHQWKL